jgi:hypothetical protein
MPSVDVQMSNMLSCANVCHRCIKDKTLVLHWIYFFALQVFNEAPEAASHSLHTDNLQSVFSHILHPAIVLGRCNGDQCPECDKNKRARQLEARKHWIYFFALQVFNEAPEAASHSLHTDNLQSVFSHILHPAMTW